MGERRKGQGMDTAHALLEIGPRAWAAMKRENAGGLITRTYWAELAAALER